MNYTPSFTTLAKNSIRYMLLCVSEYEQIKQCNHPEFKTARSFFKAKGICFQNFYKFYNRYKASGGDPGALLPARRGPKPKYQELPFSDDSIVSQVLKYREKGYNRYIIAAAISNDKRFKTSCSASTVYRILRAYGKSRLTSTMIKDKRTLIRDKVGSLGHIDCHVLPKGLISSTPNKRYYVIGCIDNYSRVCWVEVIDSPKAINTCFAMLDIILLLHQRYEITFEEVLTDNGSEFCGGKSTMESHPFERLLIHYAIKHRRTKPYRPQTNGKIERFWRTFDDEVIEGTEYESLDQLKDSVLGYNFFYNEQRPHQGLGGKTPQSMIKNIGD